MSEPATSWTGTPDRTRRRELHRIFFDLLLMAFLGTFVVISLDLRSGPGQVPLIVGVPTLAAMIVRTVLDVRGSVGEAADDSRLGHASDDQPVRRQSGELASASLSDLTRAAKEEAAAEAEVATSHQEIRRQRTFALWGLALVGAAVLATTYLIPPFGLQTYFVPTAVVGLLFIIRWVGISWVRTIAITAGVGAFMYLMLGVFLSVRL